jgi:hypothetical protein
MSNYISLGTVEFENRQYVAVAYIYDKATNAELRINDNLRNNPDGIEQCRRLFTQILAADRPNIERAGNSLANKTIKQVTDTALIYKQTEEAAEPETTVEHTAEAVNRVVELSQWLKHPATIPPTARVAASSASTAAARPVDHPTSLVPAPALSSAIAVPAPAVLSSVSPAAAAAVPEYSGLVVRLIPLAFTRPADEVAKSLVHRCSQIYARPGVRIEDELARFPGDEMLLLASRPTPFTFDRNPPTEEARQNQQKRLALTVMDIALEFLGKQISAQQVASLRAAAETE